jgi:hypothetical protein
MLLQYFDDDRLVVVNVFAFLGGVPIVVEK